MNSSSKLKADELLSSLVQTPGPVVHYRINARRRSVRLSYCIQSVSTINSPSVGYVANDAMDILPLQNDFRKHNLSDIKGMI